MILARIRPNIQKFQSERSAEDLFLGNLCVAQVWSGNLLKVQEKEKELCLLKKSEEHCSSPSIEYILPSKGAEMWCDCMAIPINAEHPNNAHKFINFILRPEIAGEITNQLFFANANKDSKPYINPDILNNPIVYPPEKIMKKVFIEKTIPANIERWRTRQFIRIKKKDYFHG